MKIGILGTGVVGHALGKGLLALGHDVMMGAREAGNEKAAAFAAAGGERASAGTFAEAAAFGDWIVLATLGTANEPAIRQAGIDRFAGKILLDTTNPLAFGPAGPSLTVGWNDSGGEQVQRLVPAAKVVKVFNTVGNALMFRPQLAGGPPSMFIAGDDEGAKDVVAALLTTFGWEPIDLGGIEASRYLEPMCLAWVLHGIRSGSWGHAYKLLR
jgi:hypothetical protein